MFIKESRHFVSSFLFLAPVRIFLLCSLLLSFSCSQPQSIYDRTGFDPGTAPSQNGPNSVQKVAPDYYYRQQQNSYQQPIAQAPYQYPQPTYQQPYAATPYQVYPNPASRFYSNPYAIPPSSYYPQYDADQYYVPPQQYYYKTEPQNDSRFDKTENRDEIKQDHSY